MDININNFIWTDGIELALHDIKTKSFYNSDYHKQNYYFFKGYLKYFRIPTIVLSGMNSVFSVGLQPFISQVIISGLCCFISLVCGIIASVELFLGIQNMMEKELVASKEFYILYCDIFKTLSVERKYRNVDGKIYLDNIHTRYCNLIGQCNLLNEQIENLQIANFTNNNNIEDKNTQQHDDDDDDDEDDEDIVVKIVKNNTKHQKQKEANATKINISECPNSEDDNL
jgi:hypothetical protein